MEGILLPVSSYVFNQSSLGLTELNISINEYWAKVNFKKLYCETNKLAS